MDVMKNLRTLLVRALALLGILVGFTLIINLSWFDEDLHPDLVRLIPPQPVSMQGNAYPLVYGFPAASDQDSLEAGLNIVQSLRERHENEQPVTLTAEEIDEILGNPTSDDVWNGSYPSISCNSRFDAECAATLISDFEQSNQIHPRLQVLLGRYETALTMSRFEENQEFDAYTPLPAYRQLMDIARIRLANSYLNKSTDEFLADISADIGFWKLMLRDGQSLVAKMVALAGLRNDTTFLSTLIRSKELDDEELQLVTRTLTLLTDEERDIGETFLSEMRISLLTNKSLAVVLEGPSWITQLALQGQATINEYYLATTIPLMLRAAQSAEEFYRQRGHDPLSYKIRAVPPPLYNLGGKFVLKWTASENNIQDYVSRVHDLEGRIALVLLQAEIAANPQRGVEDVVRLSTYRNPYTLDPMDYDRSSQTIGFDCLSNSEDICTVRIGDSDG